LAYSNIEWDTKVAGDPHIHNRYMKIKHVTLSHCVGVDILGHGSFHECGVLVVTWPNKSDLFVARW